MVLFGVLEAMNILLSSGIEVVNPSLDNETLSQYLAMCVEIYRRAYPSIPLEQYQLMAHSIVVPFMDSPYPSCKQYYQKYREFLFNPTLYASNLSLIAEHFVELIVKNTETKEGLSVKFQFLLSVVSARQRESESTGEGKQQFKDILEEITTMFVSVLDPKMSGELYVNMVMMLWAISRDQMAWQAVLGLDVLDKIDVVRYLKRKGVLEDSKKEFFGELVKTIIKNKEYHKLSEPTTIKYIEYLNSQDIGVNLEEGDFPVPLAPLST